MNEEKIDKKNILIQDFEEILENKSIKWKNFKNKTFLLTGANGFIATYMVHFLIFLNEELNFNIKLIIISKNKKKFKSNFENVFKRMHIHFIEQDVSDKIKISKNTKIDFILHAASKASPKLFNKSPIETILPNIFGTYNLLKISCDKKIKSFIFFSSGEIYGDHTEIVDENNLSYFNHLNNRASYAESKKMGETLCYSFFKQKNIPIKILRLFHTYGPCMNLNDERVMMDFVKSIITQKKILLRSNGNQKRSFCYIADVVKGIFILLSSGKNGEAYNLANPKETITIKQLALKLAKNNNVKLNKFINKKSKLTNFVKNAIPSIKKINALGFDPTTSIDKGFKRTIKYFSKNK